MAAVELAPLCRCSKCDAELPHTNEFFHRYRCGQATRLRRVCKCCRGSSYGDHKTPRKGLTDEDRREANKLRCQENYRRNRDNRLATMREWRRANPDYEKERRPSRRQQASEYKKAKWAAMDPTARAEKRRALAEWKAANPEKVKAIEARRLARVSSDPAYREAAARRMRLWRKNNPESTAAARDRRRAREWGSDGSYDRDDVRAILKVQGRACYYCSVALKIFECDHFIPLAKGGSNAADNIVLSCPRCNYSKGAKLPWEWMPSRFSEGDVPIRKAIIPWVEPSSEHCE